MNTSFKIKKTMILGTHNSMSYLPCKWYMKPFNFIAKCQNKTIKQQLELGVEIFDLRIRFKYGTPYFCHGLLSYYNASFIQILSIISNHNKGKSFYIRLVLETNKEDIKQEKLFKDLCNNLIKCNPFPNLLYFEGTRRYDWKIIYPFNTTIELTQLVGSMQGLPWFPRLYAKIFNKNNLKTFKNTNKWCIFDFINIKDI